MKSLWTIAWRDFKATVMTPMFYVIGGLSTLIWSFMYIRVIDLFSERSMQMAFQSRGQAEGLSLHMEVFSRHIGLVNFFMVVAVPALTMKLLAEEKKQRTYDLLLTSPVNATQIALGKFLAGFAVSMVLVSISFLYPLTTSFFAELQWGPLISAYIGLSLVVAAYVAVGVFASSLTESVVLAVVMAVIFNLSLWFIGSAGEAVEEPTVAAFFEQLSLGQHFLSFIKGSVEVSAIAFFLSVVALYTFLTQRVIESSRWR